MPRKTREEFNRQKKVNQESNNHINQMRTETIEYVGLSEKGIQRLKLVQNLQASRAAEEKVGV